MTLLVVSGRGYRAISAGGAITATLIALLIANLHALQAVITTYVPLIRRLQPTTLHGEAFSLAALTTLLAFGFAVAPLYKPQPRRILNVVYHTHYRIIIAGLALATIGYFDYTYRLPRATLLLTTGVLLVLLPAWFVAIRRRPDGNGDRILIIGDDLAEIKHLHNALDTEPVGYVGPAFLQADGGIGMAESRRPDGSIGAQGRLGGLSRLAEVIISHKIDTAAFAFERTDRGEFFGALGIRHDYGVAAVIRRDCADSVLIADQPGKELVHIDVEPWDWQDRAIKRTFDITFALTALLALSPIILVIAAAVKLEDGGSILYEQDRTAELGETFSVYKFRSMVENAEAVSGVKLSEEDAGGQDPRVTRVGRLLRKTHFDEIPQMWSILVGDMSVVGPRPERPALDSDIGNAVIKWEQRWFVKPGLTGLAQINDVTGYEPAKKLRHDVEYIRNQSLRYDIAIVLRQLWRVLMDALTVLRGGDPESDE